MESWFKVVNTLEQLGEPYVLITVMGARGSTPRDSGTKMVVTANESYCTIGGGHLEYMAIEHARDMIKKGKPDFKDGSKSETKTDQKIEHFPLGAKLGQCCGGSTSLFFELFTGAELNIVLFGAGHVAKTLVPILAQLPCRLFWVDNRDHEFPQRIPDNVIRMISEEPANEVANMPANSYYVVMTHNHPLDFDITEAILHRNDALYVGLIGSKTKWQRFQMRFAHKQYDPEFYASVRCPVGLSNVPGKLPIEIAVSIAGEIIQGHHKSKPQQATQRGISHKELKELTLLD